ncbi:hypothetical protein Cva_00764 [Caedimonas varicaedens]|uniref:Uncharacterized protein n=1 Tax=Caedimonas varicaedens TaxID=1629334 RepID=A0A0K8MC74_9PROT|nr:hypothetical protein Cva_00764 [Caedimonas varicaedens]
MPADPFARWRTSSTADPFVRWRPRASSQEQPEHSPSSSEETDPEERSYSLLDRLDQFLGGIKSNAEHMGSSFAMADPLAHLGMLGTQRGQKAYLQDKQNLKDYQQDVHAREAKTLENMDSTGRILHHTGEFIDPSIVLPSFGTPLKIGTTLSKAPRIAKALDVGKKALSPVVTDLGMGATSGVLQEGGMHPILSDLIATFAPHYAYKGGKWMFSPSYRQEVSRSKAEKEVGGLMRETLDVPDASAPGKYPTDHPLYKDYQRAGQEINVDRQTQDLKRHQKLPEQFEEKMAEEVAEHAQPFQDHQHPDDAFTTIMRQDVEESQVPLNDQTAPSDAGQAMRQYLLGKLKNLYRKRSQETGPLYQELMGIEEGLEPAHAREVIAHKLDTAKGDVRSHLDRVEKELQPNDPTPLGQKTLTPEQQEELSALKAYLAQFENHRDYTPQNPSPAIVNIRKRIHDLEGVPSSPRQPVPAEIDNTLKWLGDEIASARKQGKDGLARELTDVKRAIEEDLSSLPQGTEYRQQYNELSKPINALEEHGTLGKIVGEKKNTYSQQYTLSDGEIPSKVIGTSLKSADDAKALLTHLKGKKGQEVLSHLRGAIHHAVLNGITGADGKISRAKIASWQKNHPGAFVLYPELKHHLEDISHAQHMLDLGIPLTSKQDAHTLLHHLRQHKGQHTQEVLQGIINKKIVEAITANDKISHTAIERWKKSHPGAFVLYPDLEKRLNHLYTAQKFFDMGLPLTSRKQAQELMGHLKSPERHAHRKIIEGVIHKNVLDFITDDGGKVSLDKLNKWTKNNPGAFVLYPQLETKLKNLANAQHFTDTLLTKMRDRSLLEVHQSLGLKLGKKALRKILPLGIGDWLVDIGTQTLGATKNALREEVMEKALSDPEMATLLMTPLKDLSKNLASLTRKMKAGWRIINRTGRESKHP